MEQLNISPIDVGDEVMADFDPEIFHDGLFEFPLGENNFEHAREAMNELEKNEIVAMIRHYKEIGAKRIFDPLELALDELECRLEEDDDEYAEFLADR